MVRAGTTPPSPRPLDDTADPFVLWGGNPTRCSPVPVVAALRGGRQGCGGGRCRVGGLAFRLSLLFSPVAVSLISGLSRPRARSPSPGLVVRRGVPDSGGVAVRLLTPSSTRRGTSPSRGSRTLVGWPLPLSGGAIPRPGYGTVRASPGACHWSRKVKLLSLILSGREYPTSTPSSGDGHTVIGARRGGFHQRNLETSGGIEPEVCHGYPGWACQRCLPPSSSCWLWTLFPTAAHVRTGSARPRSGPMCGRDRGGLPRLVWGRAGPEVMASLLIAGYLIEKSLAVANFSWGPTSQILRLTAASNPHRFTSSRVLGALFPAVFSNNAVAPHSSAPSPGSSIFRVDSRRTSDNRNGAHRTHTSTPERSLVLAMFRRHVPMTDAYHGQRLRSAERDPAGTPVVGWSWSRSRYRRSVRG